MNSEVLKKIRIVATILSVVAGVGLAIIYFQKSVQTSEPATAPRFGGKILQPFELEDQNGETVLDSDVLGHPAVFFFGFTNCPDVCPTTLVSMTQWMKDLGGQADSLRVYFVTVDPERDTGAVLKDYIAPFDSRIRALRGPEEQLRALTKPLGVFAEKVPLQGGGYSVDHTASVVLIDRSGQFSGTIAYGEDGKTALEKLRLLIGET